MNNPYFSYHSNFGDQKGLEWIADGGAYQHTPISGLTSSSQLELPQDQVSQQLKDLMAVKAHIDAKLLELQDLYQKQQDILTRLRAFDVTTTTPMWNIPPQPTTPTSSSSGAPYTQTVTHPSPVYTTHNRADEKTAGEAHRKLTWNHRTLENTKRRHICQQCGKAYTRKDSLLRHAAIHALENAHI